MLNIYQKTENFNLVFGFSLSLHPIFDFMKKEEIDLQQYSKILECIMKALMKTGVKATTMDSIASSLQMSKRTLYEIFGSKEEMFLEAHKFFHKKMALALKDIFETSDNVMEAIIKCFLFNRDLMSNVNADFIRDIEQLAKKGEMISQDNHRHHYQNLYDVLSKGVKEGYFRDDVNLKVQCRMLSLQMESLKRSVELFPEDISLLEIYDSIIIGFLRGISSSKGLEEIEKFIPALTSNLSQK